MWQVLKSPQVRRSEGQKVAVRRKGLVMGVHPETAHGFEYDARWGTRIDGSVVKFWGRKSDAVNAARFIGWPLVSVWPVWTRFQRGYAIKQEHEGFLTHQGYALLAESAR